MKILIVISQMICGGAERVVYNTYRALLKKKVKVTLLVLGDFYYDLFSDLKKEHVVLYKREDCKGKLKTNISKVKFIKRHIKSVNPDLIVSFVDTTNILTILANLGSSYPLIISERNNPDFAKISKPWFLLRRILYRYADCLLVANKGLSKRCEDRFRVKKIEITPNMIKLNHYSRMTPKLRIVAVGSLTLQKRFDILIDAIKLLNGRSLLGEFTVDIYGVGPLQNLIKEKIKENQLTNIIQLKGLSSDIFHEYVNAEIFVLSSDYEGQPNVLLEAMSSGLACVSTNCDFGPSELINHGEDGLLVDVNSPEQLADALEKLIQNDLLREELGKNAKEKITESFSEDVVIKKWLDVFQRVIKNESSHSSL